MFDFDWKTLGTPIWLIHLFGLVMLTVVTNYAVALLIKYLQKRLLQNSIEWDDMLLEALRTPIRLVIWVLGLGFALTLVEIDVKDWDGMLDSLRRVGIIVAAAWFAFRFVGGYQNHRIKGMEDHNKSDPTAILAIARLLRASIIITTSLVIVETMGFSISGVLAFGGVGGVAVGFAAKDMLSNFFGGLMIFLDRPFTVGDWIKSPDRDIEGIVENIGWRMTVVRNFDKEPVYIPNSTFSSIAVVTPSRMSHRRIRETLGLRYDDIKQLPVILERIRAQLSAHEQLDQEMPVIVRLDRFGDSSLELLLQCFTRTTVWAEYMEVKEDILLAIARIIEEEQAEFAFPTQTLHMAATLPSPSAADEQLPVRP